MLSLKKIREVIDVKKFLSTLIIGAFVFGLGAFNIQTASAAHFHKAGYSAANKPGYSTKKPEQPNKLFGDRQGHQQRHRKISR